MLAACGSSGGSQANASAEDAASPFDEAFAVICEGRQPTNPQVTAHSGDQMPSAVFDVWKVGFCQGEAGVKRWEDSGSSAFAEIARQGDAAREALSRVPPDCAAVAGTPVEGFCR